jgi:hypothetical protein
VRAIVASRPTSCTTNLTPAFNTSRLHTAVIRRFPFSLASLCAARAQNAIQFPSGIDPFWPNGSLLPLISNSTVAPVGSGDNKVQAYNFRCHRDHCAAFNYTPRALLPPSSRLSVVISGISSDTTWLQTLHDAKHLQHAAICCAPALRRKYLGARTTLHFGGKCDQYERFDDYVSCWRGQDRYEQQRTRFN